MSVAKTPVSVKEESVKIYQERSPVIVQRGILLIRNQESVKVNRVKMFLWKFYGSELF